MKIYLSNKFKKSFSKLKKKDSKIVKKAKKQLAILQQNPNHPSLRLHKLEGKLAESWSISVDKNNRITFVYSEGSIVLTNIGSHQQVY